MPQKLIRLVIVKDLHDAPTVRWFSDKDRSHAELAYAAARDTGLVVIDEFDAPNEVQIADFLNVHARLHGCAKTKIKRANPGNPS